MFSQACECLSQEEKCAKHMKARVEHIKGHANEQKSAAVLWKKKRVDRMLVDHFLRSGFYETASILARDSDIEVKRNRMINKRYQKHKNAENVA